MGYSAVYQLSLPTAHIYHTLIASETHHREKSSVRYIAHAPNLSASHQPRPETAKENASRQPHSCFPWYPTFPDHHIECPISVLCRSSVEALHLVSSPFGVAMARNDGRKETHERVIFTPLLALLRQPRLCQRGLCDQLGPSGNMLLVLGLRDLPWYSSVPGFDKCRKDRKQKTTILQRPTDATEIADIQSTIMAMADISSL